MPDRSRRLTVLALVVLGASMTLHAQKPAVEDVLKAAGDYLVTYAQQLGVVAAEEDYTQYNTRVTGATRTFMSDFVLVGLSDGRIAGYRDVYSIDANNVRKRDDRLLKLFEGSPSAWAHDEALAITDAPLRMYLGTSLRALDIPTSALEYLRLPNQSNSAFTVDSVKKQGGVQVAIVKFKVTSQENLPPTPEGATTTGRFWIETETGAVRQSEVSVSGTAFRFNAQSKYVRDAAVGLWVPSELYQQIEISGAVQGTSYGNVAMSDGVMSTARQSFEGRTKYSKYRRRTSQP